MTSGLMGEGRTKRVRQNEAVENPRKAPRMDPDDILAAADEVDLGGTKACGSANSDSYAVKGMPNFGNTCYLNALLQCLLALGKLRKMILKPDAKLGLMGMALKDLFVKTNNASYPGKFIDPAMVTACIRAWNATFKGTEMQDSQELFLAVLSRIGEEQKEEEDPRNPPHLHDEISLIFRGKICLRDSCSCSKVNSEYLDFEDLGLPMPTIARNDANLTEVKQIWQYKDRAQTNQFGSLALIEDCLKLYFKAEKITFCCSSTDRSKSDEQTVTSCLKTVSSSCSTANQTPVYPKTVQENLPSCLSAEKQVTLICAQHNRNDDTQNQNRAEEATVNEGASATRAIFITKLPPVLVLYLQRFRMNSEGSYAIKLSGHISFEEFLNVGQFMEPSCEDTNSIYYLAGVIEHIGSTPTSGHYVAYVKAKAGVWFRVGDHVTRQVSLQEVLQCEAYMLFYEKG